LTPLELLGYALMGAGTFFLATSALGMFVFKEALSRLHAGTKLVSGGALLLFVGVALSSEDPSISAKALMVALFLLITSPMSSHSLGRAYLRGGRKR